MSGNSDDAGTVKRLQEAAKSTALAETVRAQARQLSDRLVQGVRIAVVGPKGVGKSSLCDAFLSCSNSVSRQDATWVFRPQPRDVSDLPISGKLEHMACDLSNLGNATLIDVAMTSNPLPSQEQMLQALQTADIVLWCTQNFEDAETALWSNVPDTLKDHSFLVLTKADVLAAEGALQSRIAELAPVVSEEFHSFFPITTQNVRTLQLSGKTVDRGQFAASGLKSLVDAVFSLVASGQRADLDSAMLFLDRHGLNSNRSGEEPHPEPAQDPETRDATSADHVSDQSFQVSRDTINACVSDLSEIGLDPSTDDFTEVLDLCVTVSLELAETFRKEVGDRQDASEWCDAFEDASDKVTLMSMENDARSAADAVTILLQLRRDLDQLSIQ